MVRVACRAGYRAGPRAFSIVIDLAKGAFSCRFSSPYGLGTLWFGMERLDFVQQQNTQFRLARFKLPAYRLLEFSLMKSLLRDFAITGKAAGMWSGGPARAGSRSVMQAVLAWVAGVFSALSVIFSALVLSGSTEQPWEFGAPWFGMPPSPAQFLACLLIANVLLLGFMLVRETSVLHSRTRQRDVAGDALEQSEARLRLAQAAAGIATTDWDIAADKAVLSANFSEVFGIHPVSDTGKSHYEIFISMVHPDDRARIDAMHLRLLKTGGSFSDEFRVCLADGEIRWIAMRGEVFCDSRGIARRLIGSNFDITERRHSEEKLKRSLGILELANDAGEIGVWNNDFTSKKATIDRRTCNMLGLPPEGAGFSFSQFIGLLHPSDQDRVRNTFLEARRTGQRFSVECRVDRPDGMAKWVRISGQADIDPKSLRATRMTGIVFDITPRREREQHLRFLMQEITHRSKNLLAVIQAMARQTRSTARTLDEFQTLFAARLQGLAASHDLLVNENWHGAWLDEIIRSQVAPLTDLVGKRIVLNGPRLQVKPEAAQNIGMAIHELAINASRFGALSSENGRVNISWTNAATENGEHRLKLDWQEIAGPVVEVPDTRGFGSIVTERIVPRALDGRVQLCFRPSGVTWSLDISSGFILAPASAVE